MNRGAIELMAGAVMLLQKKPRTKPELMELLDLNRSKAATDYINALMAEGLVEEVGRRDNTRADGIRRGIGAMEYRWVKHEQ